MELRDIITRYKQLARGAFGVAVALGDFGLTREEMERVFSLLDEDYHISRYFDFTNQSSVKADAAFSINGFPQTHVSIDKEVEEIL